MCRTAFNTSPLASVTVFVRQPPQVGVNRHVAVVPLSATLPNVALPLNSQALPLTVVPRDSASAAHLLVTLIVSPDAALSDFRRFTSQPLSK